MDKNLILTILIKAILIFAILMSFWFTQHLMEQYNTHEKYRGYIAGIVLLIGISLIILIGYINVHLP